MRGEITVDEGRVQVQFLSRLQQQIALLDREGNWTAGELAYWLDRRVRHSDVTQQEMGVFLVNLLQRLLDKRNIGELWQARSEGRCLFDAQRARPGRDRREDRLGAMPFTRAARLQVAASGPSH